MRARFVVVLSSAALAVGVACNSFGGDSDESPAGTTSGATDASSETGRSSSGASSSSTSSSGTSGSPATDGSISDADTRPDVVAPPPSDTICDEYAQGDFSAIGSGAANRTAQGWQLSLVRDAANAPPPATVTRVFPRPVGLPGVLTHVKVDVTFTSIAGVNAATNVDASSVAELVRVYAGSAPILTTTPLADIGINLANVNLSAFALWQSGMGDISRLTSANIALPVQSQFAGNVVFNLDYGNVMAGESSLSATSGMAPPVATKLTGVLNTSSTDVTVVIGGVIAGAKGQAKLQYLVPRTCVTFQ